MAVAVQSISQLAFASRTATDNIVITKPTGLVAGDLMVAIIENGGETNTITPPTNWQEIITIAPGSYYLTSYWKIADSSDAAATNFTFDTTTTAVSAAYMYRIDGHEPSNPIYSFNGTNVSNTANPSFAAAITPAANSLLILGFTGQNLGTPTTTSAYAIATSNPTWTERGDINSLQSILSTATASRPESTSTGNFSCTLDSGDTTNSWRGLIIAIQPILPLTFNLSNNYVQGVKIIT